MRVEQERRATMLVAMMKSSCGPMLCLAHQKPSLVVRGCATLVAAATSAGKHSQFAPLLQSARRTVPVSCWNQSRPTASITGGVPQSLADGPRPLVSCYGERNNT